MKEIVVLFGAGSIGQAIVRRIAVGKHVLLADYHKENALKVSQITDGRWYHCQLLVRRFAVFKNKSLTTSCWRGNRGICVFA